MLRIRNLFKTYRQNQKPALSNINLEIKKGEFAALLGQNGAGKSTLINILAGNVIEDRGRYRERPVHRSRPRGGNRRQCRRSQRRSRFMRYRRHTGPDYKIHLVTKRV